MKLTTEQQMNYTGRQRGRYIVAAACQRLGSTGCVQHHHLCSAYHSLRKVPL